MLVQGDLVSPICVISSHRARAKRRWLLAALGQAGWSHRNGYER